MLLVVSSDPGGFEWSAPEGCADETSMRARMEDAGGLGGLNVRGEVHDGGGETWTLALTLELDGIENTRRVQGHDCAEIADAAVLLVAEEVDAAQRTPEPEVPPEVGLPTEPAAPLPSTLPPANGPVAVSPRDVGVRPSRSMRIAESPLPTGLHLGVSLGVSAGAVPFPGVPFEAVMGWSRPQLRVALRGRYHLAARESLGGGRSARVHLGTAGLEVCGRPRVDRLEFPLCGQGSLGGSRSAGRGQTRDRAGVWAEVGADTGIAWHLTPRWALALRLGAAATLVGTRYVLGEDVTFEPARVQGRAAVGFEHTFF